MASHVDILVISPHPDDVDFGASGSVARLSKQGKKVAYVICTSGDKGTHDRSMKPEHLAQLRETEQRAAAMALGVCDVVFLRHPDQGLEDSFEFRKQLVRLIRRYQPSLVLSCDPYRRYVWHRDHRITGQVVLDAVFPYARDHLAYPDLILDGLEPHVVPEVWLWGTEDPNLKIDISDTIDLKLKALRCHESQMKDYPRVEAMVRNWAIANAEGEEYQYAEQFHQIRYRR
jgi:LmbE family N-acetylglucosaminyl deacetylase